MMNFELINAELSILCKSGELRKLHHTSRGTYEQIENDLSKWAINTYKRYNGVYGRCKCYKENGIEDKGYNFTINFDSTRKDNI